MKPNYIFFAKFVRCRDADTLILNIDLGFRVHTEQPVRIALIDAPERHTPEGRFALQEVETFLTAHPNLLIRSILSKVALNQTMTFDRWVAEIWLVEDLTYLAGWMVTNKLARPMDL